MKVCRALVRELRELGWEIVEERGRAILMRRGNQFVRVPRFFRERHGVENWRHAHKSALSVGARDRR